MALSNHPREPSRTETGAVWSVVRLRAEKLCGLWRRGGEGGGLPWATPSLRGPPAGPGRGRVAAKEGRACGLAILSRSPPSPFRPLPPQREHARRVAASRTRSVKQKARFARDSASSSSGVSSTPLPRPGPRAAAAGGRAGGRPPGKHAGANGPQQRRGRGRRASPNNSAPRFVRDGVVWPLPIALALQCEWLHDVSQCMACGPLATVAQRLHSLSCSGQDGGRWAAGSGHCRAAGSRQQATFGGLSRRCPWTTNRPCLSLSPSLSLASPRLHQIQPLTTTTTHHHPPPPTPPPPHITTTHTTTTPPPHHTTTPPHHHHHHHHLTTQAQVHRSLAPHSPSPHPPPPMADLGLPGGAAAHVDALGARHRRDYAKALWAVGINSSNEAVLLSCPTVRISSKDKRLRRQLVVTDLALYVFPGGDMHKVKRRVMLSDIDAILLATENLTRIVLVVSDDDCNHLQLDMPNRSDLVDTIAVARECRGLGATSVLNLDRRHVDRLLSASTSLNRGASTRLHGSSTGSFTNKSSRKSRALARSSSQKALAPRTSSKDSKGSRDSGHGGLFARGSHMSMKMLFGGRANSEEDYDDDGGVGDGTAVYATGRADSFDMDGGFLNPNLRLGGGAASSEEAAGAVDEDEYEAMGDLPFPSRTATASSALNSTFGGGGSAGGGGGGDGASSSAELSAMGNLALLQCPPAAGDLGPMTILWKRMEHTLLPLEVRQLATPELMRIAHQLVSFSGPEGPSTPEEAMRAVACVLTEPSLLTTLALEMGEHVYPFVENLEAALGCDIPEVRRWAAKGLVRALPALAAIDALPRNTYWRAMLRSRGRDTTDELFRMRALNATDSIMSPEAPQQTLRRNSSKNSTTAEGQQDSLRTRSRAGSSSNESTNPARQNSREHTEELQLVQSTLDVPRQASIQHLRRRSSTFIGATATELLATLRSRGAAARSQSPSVASDRDDPGATGATAGPGNRRSTRIPAATRPMTDADRRASRRVSSNLTAAGASSSGGPGPSLLGPPNPISVPKLNTALGRMWLGRLLDIDAEAHGGGDRCGITTLDLRTLFEVLLSQGEGPMPAEGEEGEDPAQSRLEPFGATIYVPEIIEALLGAVTAIHSDTARRDLLKQIALLLVRNPTGTRAFLNMAEWQNALLPLLLSVPLEESRRSPAQSDVLKYTLHIMAVLHMHVFEQRDRAHGPIDRVWNSTCYSLAVFAGWKTMPTAVARDILGGILKLLGASSVSPSSLWRFEPGGDEWEDLFRLMHALMTFLFYRPSEYTADATRMVDGHIMSPSPVRASRVANAAARLAEEREKSGAFDLMSDDLDTDDLPEIRPSRSKDSKDSKDSFQSAHTNAANPKRAVVPLGSSVGGVSSSRPSWLARRKYETILKRAPKHVQNSNQLRWAYMKLPTLTAANRGSRLGIHLEADGRCSDLVLVELAIALWRNMSVRGDDPRQGARAAVPVQEGKGARHLCVQSRSRAHFGQAALRAHQCFCSSGRRSFARAPPQRRPGACRLDGQGQRFPEPPAGVQDGRHDILPESRQGQGCGHSTTRQPCQAAASRRPACVRQVQVLKEPWLAIQHKREARWRCEPYTFGQQCLAKVLERRWRKLLRGRIQLAAARPDCCLCQGADHAGQAPDGAHGHARVAAFAKACSSPIAR